MLGLVQERTLGKMCNNYDTYFCAFFPGDTTPENIHSLRSLERRLEFHGKILPPC